MRDDILQYVKEKSRIDKCERLLLSVSTKDVAENLTLERTRVSKILNQAVKQKELLKIRGKPVRYIFNFYDLEQVIWPDTDSLWESIFNQSLGEGHKEENVFESLIGSKSSLSYQVNQAKAAILYPPRGIHTLITGPSGVGKTTFARTMYEYAVSIGQLPESAPYIYYNCADYAGNTQLLMSLLFGHTKGAFTGADSEKKGLVDSANGGILFLDEIHRLPPEGQEMLFSILDEGKFRRLGESNNTFHTTELLLIGATTENISETILGTFRRRIPNLITLSGLEERSIEERIQLINHFFKYESSKIKNAISVNYQVVEYLSTYECKGNIGQLKNDIQMICARAFAQAIINDTPEVPIHLENVELTEAQRVKFLKRSREQMGLTQDRILQKRELRFNNGQNLDEFSNKEHFFDANNYQREQAFYRKLLEKYETSLLKQNNRKSVELITKEALEEFFSVELFVDQKEQKLGKIISKQVYKAVLQLFSELENEVKLKFDTQVVYSLALHIEGLIARMKSGTVQPSANEETLEYSDDLNIFNRVQKCLNNELKMKIPRKEIIIMCMFLQAIHLAKQTDNIGILVIMHGDGTASSMARVVNDLLETNHARAIDMKLDDSIDKILEQATQYIKELDNGKGVLLLVDMGSLTNFEAIINKRMNNRVRSIKYVTTPILLEAVRKSLIPSMTLDTLVEDLADSLVNAGDFSPSRYIVDYEESLPSLDDNLRFDKRMKKLIQDSVIFLNTDQSVYFIDTVISKICGALNIVISDALYIKMQFHCQSMIERAIRKEPLINERNNESLDTKSRIWTTIRKEFKFIENAYSIRITDDELAYLVEIIENMHT
jgi:transcriptional regulator with AAA-type ATPase domain/transcriptional regulatory protein LevR